ncbi:hypothetical protein Tco_1261872 [Tanacetum coccineum]
MILEKIIINLEDEVVSLLEKEKELLETIESLKSKGVESCESEISESKNQYENLKSKVVDCTMFQTLQVQVTNLKRENEYLKLSVEEFTKAREIVEATLRERDEMVSAQCEKIRLLDEQVELFYGAQSELD